MAAKAFCLGMMLAGTMLGSGAMAQAPAQLPVLADDGEIIVTAQRRSEELQKVPVSVTAITPVVLEQLNLRDIQSVATVSPGVTFDTGLGFAQVFVRGIGANFPAPGLESPVATYVDGSYVERAAGTLFSLLDMASVQVLKGPQGTLYGRNATGGVVLLNTADPVQRFEGHALAEYGRFDHVLLEGVVNAPLSDTVAVRVAGRFVREDGYVDNLTSGKSAGGGRQYVVRGKLKWEPTDDFAATLGVEHSRQTFRDPNFSRQILEAPLCLACALGGQAPTGTYEVRNDVSGRQINRNTSVNLHLRGTMGIVTLDSVTAYRDLSSDNVTVDLDGTDLPLFEFANAVGSKTFTQDITVSTETGAWYDALFGVNFLREKAYGRPSPRGLSFQALVDAVGQSPMSDVDILTQSVSFFVEGTVRPAPRLSVTVGGRYNYDERELDGRANLAAILAFGGGSSPSEWSQSISFGSFTPRVVVAYDAGPVNLYASYNRGFRAGGYNTPTFAPQVAVKPETIDSYEAGLKFVSEDRKLRINLAGFYYKQKNIQVSITDVNSGGSVVQNAASADAYGGEVDASYSFSPAFSLNGGASYIHARYQSYTNASVVVVTPAGLAQGMADLSGRQTPRSPEITAFVGISGEVPVSESWILGFSGVVRYTDNYDFFPGASGPLGLDRQPATTMVNGSAFVGPADGQFQIGAYVNNLLNEVYYQNVSTAAPFGTYNTVALPRTFGVRVKYNF